MIARYWLIYATGDLLPVSDHACCAAGVCKGSQTVALTPCPCSPPKRWRQLVPIRRSNGMLWLRLLTGATAFGRSGRLRTGGDIFVPNKDV